MSKIKIRYYIVYLFLMISIIINIYYYNVNSRFSKNEEQHLRTRLENDATIFYMLKNRNFEGIQDVLIEDISTYKKIMKIKYKRELSISSEIDSLTSFMKK